MRPQVQNSFNPEGRRLLGYRQGFGKLEKALAAPDSACNAQASPTAQHGGRHPCNPPNPYMSFYTYIHTLFILTRALMYMCLYMYMYICMYV